MGTVNYLTSDIVTLGIDPNEYRDEDGVYDDSLVEDEINSINGIIVRYGFDSLKAGYKVETEYGYYEGFCIKITDMNRCLYLDEEDKEEIVDALLRLKECIHECNKFAPVCYPGWGTTYLRGKKENDKAIENAFEKYINELKKAPWFDDCKEMQK